MERPELHDHANIRVLVWDTCPMHTQLVADAMRRDATLDIFVADSPQGLMGTVLEHDVDVLVISSTLEGQRFGGLEVLQQVRVVSPKTCGVLLLDSSQSELVLEAFRSGAHGVFHRCESIEQLCKCVRCVHQGQIWAKSSELSVALNALKSVPSFHALDAKGMNLLSKREMDIVHCLAEGLTNREIALRLQLSQHTVKNHLFRIFDKLGVSSRVELLFMTASQRVNSPSTGDVDSKTVSRSIRNVKSKIEGWGKATEQTSALSVRKQNAARSAMGRISNWGDWKTRTGS